MVKDHSPSRQQTRIVLFTFERGQKRGLVFTPLKIEAKEIQALDMKYHVELKKKKNLKREEFLKKIPTIKRSRYVTK